MSYLGVGVSPANIPINQATNFNIVDKQVRLTDLLFRCFTCILAVLSAVLLTTAHQVKEVFMVEKIAKFNQVKALTFLVTANGITAAYLLLHAGRCVVGVAKGHVLFSKPLAWFIFSGDQLVAYMMLSATAAASQAAVLAKFGSTELQWLEVCNVFGKFCNQIGEGIASGLLVCIGMAAISAISAFNVFRLYGGKKSAKW